MDVRYQCTLEDYKEAQVAHWTPSKGRRVLRAFLIGLILASGIRLYIASGGTAGVLPLAGLLLWFLLRFVYRPYYLKRDYRNHPNLAREHSLSIDDSGLQARSEVAEGRRAWTAYTKYRETRNLFVLYLGSRMFEIIPKRAFSAVQLEELRNLVRQHLPTK
jgi:YcxB-like protein